MDKYLLEILKENNTIIIPGLGALTITNSETGEIMFMPYLQHDDGKLAAFIAERDGIDEGDAKNMVAKYVREIKAELDKGETYSMFQLGEFVKADDGDFEFTHWSQLKSPSENDEESPAAAAVISEETQVEEPVIEESDKEAPVAEEPVVTTDESSKEELLDFDISAIEDTVEEVAPIVPESIELNQEEEEMKSAIEEAIEPVSEVEETPVVEEPEIELTEEEAEIKGVIEEAFETKTESKESIVAAAVTSSAVNYEDSYPKEPRVEASSQGDEAIAAPLTDQEKEEAGEIIEEEEKEKAGVGFWITLILAALLIIGGGAYVGRNYNELKQHIPFLADKEDEPKAKSLKEEMFKEIQEDKNSGIQVGADDEETNADEEMENASEEGTEEQTPVEPEVAEIEQAKPPVVETPKTNPPVISSSSSGPFKVIAGAFSSEANAKRLASEFKAKGMKSEVFLKGELFAVSMQSYATTEEANAELPKLQSMAPGAWIYYKR